MGTLPIKEAKKIKVTRTIDTSSYGHKIHLLESGKKFKEFSKDYQSLKEPENKTLYQELLNQTTLFNKTLFAFPEMVVTDSRKLYGYIADFVEGKTLSEYISQMKIDHLIYLAEQLEESIEYLSHQGCQIEDLHEENIIVNNNAGAVIDTDFYTFTSKPVELLVSYNLRRLSNCLIHQLAPNISLSYILKDPEVKISYYLAIQGKYKCSEFLKLLIIKLSNKNTNDISSVLQLRKLI